MSQGDPLSAGAYSILQAPLIEMVVNTFPEITAAFFIDDGNMCGKLEQVVEAAKLYKWLGKAKLGNIANEAKSEAYCPTQLSEEAINTLNDNGFEVIPPEKGIVIAGGPIGSDQFCIDYFNKKAHKIVDTMKVLKQMKSNPTGYTAASAQTATFLLRMCPAQSFIYCLRVGLPEHTKEAARIIDSAIFHNFFTLTDLIDLLPPDGTEQNGTIRGSTFLNLGRGGSGYGSSELMRKALYMGSVAQTAMKVGELVPRAKITTEHEANESTVWAAYNKALEDTQRLLPDADLTHLSLTAIFAKPQEKV